MFENLYLLSEICILSKPEPLSLSSSSSDGTAKWPHWKFLSMDYFHPHPSKPISNSKKPETEEVLKGVDERQNVTILAMQHSKRSHICSSLFLVTHCTCPADGSSTLPKPQWHQQPSVGHKSTNTSVRDLDSAAQEPRLCLPWGTPCCFYCTTQIFRATSCW